jgi:3',5'-cyclic-AMP phosphodiesterase
MRIIEIQEKPIHRIQFLNAAKRGGVESQVLAITKARVDSLPNGLEAILVTGDLQGVVKVWQLGTTRLLGEALADEYIMLAREGLVPNPANTGVLLAGDLYSAPDGAKRGASGDVRPVWQAFANHFRWVAGVQGNHDDFGSIQERQELENHPRIHLIDFDVVMLEGLSVGGVGGVMGDPAKLGRKEESEFLSGLELVLKSKPDVVVLHQGPTGNELQRGSSLVTEAVLKNPVPLVVCGHVHWDEALATLGSKTQVLNVDMRAIILTN